MRARGILGSGNEGVPVQLCHVKEGKWEEALSRDCHRFFTSGPLGHTALSEQSRCNPRGPAKRSECSETSPTWEGTELLELVYKHLTRKVKGVKKKGGVVVWFSYMHWWNIVNHIKIVKWEIIDKIFWGIQYLENEFINFQICIPNITEKISPNFKLFLGFLH